MQLNELKKLNKKCHMIADSDLYWNEKYDMIFSDDVMQHIKFKWFDPDCSEEDDVRAFLLAFDEHIIKINKINKINK